MNTHQKVAARALTLLDLTSLNDADTEADIRALCEKAISEYGNVAAVCVWPRFVKLAAELMRNTPVKVAAVANFPEGSTDIETAVKTCKEIVDAGGDEVDVVLPYRALLSGDDETPAALVSSCKKACGNSVKLKAILETGCLSNPNDIIQASKIALQNGADFIKTSTGKVEISATLHAAKFMLQTIKSTKSTSGFKASGGIKDVETAGAYLQLADEIMGPDWVSSDTFRFGASGVLSNIILVLSGGDESNQSHDGY